MFGDGLASSSDGQFLRAGGFGRNASSLNAHYGDDPGVKFYTHLSDRYAPFHTKVRSRPTATTPMVAAIPTTSSPCVRCSVPVRAAYPGPEEPAPLQLRQSIGLFTRTADRRTHQPRTNPRPLAGHPDILRVAASILVGGGENPGINGAQSVP